MNQTKHAGAGESHLEELDIIILNMDIQADEERARKLLSATSGIVAARIIQEGVWIHYDPSQVTKEKVLEKLRAAGFDASLFQDSLSGDWGCLAGLK